jgi:hypothetical protein
MAADALLPHIADCGQAAPQQKKIEQARECDNGLCPRRCAFETVP